MPPKKPAVRWPVRLLLNGRVERFHHYKAGTKQYIDYSKPECRPFRCTFKEFCERKDARIPVAFFLTKDLEILKDNYFFDKFTYAAVRVQTLHDLHKWLPEKHRNLCAQVASNAPCHWYFDLDGKLSELQLNKDSLINHKEIPRITAALLACLRGCLKKTHDREADFSGTYVISASDEKRVSLHVHITTEIAEEVENLDRWTKNALRPYIERLAQDGNEHALMLGSFVAEYPGAKPVWKHLIDPSVYSSYHVFRLPLNCKPGGNMLRQFMLTNPVYAGSRKLSDDELMFIAQPSYALAHEDAKRYLVYGERQKQSVKQPRINMNGGGSGAGAGSAVMNVSAGGGGDPTLWMRKARLPWFEARNLPFPTVEGCGINSAGYWYLMFETGTTPCITCTDRHSKGTVNNHSYLTWKPEHPFMTLNSMDKDCTEFGAYEVELPEECPTSMLHHLEEYRKLVEASERKLEDSAVTLSAMPPLEEIEVRVDEAEPEEDDAARYSGKRPRGKWDGDSKDERTAKRIKRETGMYQGWFQHHVPRPPPAPSPLPTPKGKKNVIPWVLPSS